MAQVTAKDASVAGLTKPVGTGPARYMNRSGSHPKPCLKFSNLSEPAGFTGKPADFFVRGNRTNHSLGNPAWACAQTTTPASQIFLLVRDLTEVLEGINVEADVAPHDLPEGASRRRVLLYGHPRAHYLGGYWNRLLHEPPRLLNLCATVQDGVERKEAED
jgi:hypothetical protein